MGESGGSMRGNMLSSFCGARSFGSLVALTVGLALLDIWGDMKGSLPALLVSNNLIGDAFVNGRMIGLAGIATCLFLIALKPLFLARYETCLRWVGAVLACVMSAAFVFVPMMPSSCIGVAGTVVIALSGACYGLFEALLLGDLCRKGISLKGLAAILALSLAAKSAVLPLVGMAPEPVQAACFIAAPLLIGLSCAFSGVQSIWLGKSSSGSLGKAAMGNIVAILVLFSILNATSRSVGGFGFWGAGGLVSSDGVIPMLIGVPIFLLVSYAGFATCQEQHFVSCAIRLLFVLLLGFFVLGSGVLGHPAVPPSLGDALELFMDVYSTFLLRVTIVATARTTNMHPYAVVGVGDGVMCVLALVFGGAFSLAPDAGVSILMLAMFVTAVTALLMLERGVDRSSLLPDESGIDALCSRVSQKYGLTPREAEVLVMLAQGRSQRFIAEEMTLAPSTVKTHVKHVYQKIGVSNKQELISLVHDL